MATGGERERVRRNHLSGRLRRTRLSRPCPHPALTLVLAVTLAAGALGILAGEAFAQETTTTVSPEPSREATASADGSPQAIDPADYLASLYFDGVDGDASEAYFPLRASGIADLVGARLFNEVQDANGDGAVDPEDALENVVPFRIGDAVMGVGATGLPGRGPNDQRPAVYVHVAPVDRWPGWTVAQYWVYYPAKEWLDRHEHDWEAYLIYFYEGEPQRVRLSSHGAYPVYPWQEFVGRGLVEGTHLELSVQGGSHAFQPPAAGLEDGVRLGWDGGLRIRAGRLDAAPPVSAPWQILSNDALPGALPFDPRPATYALGDPLFGSADDAAPRVSPWLADWLDPPFPFDRVFADVGVDSPHLAAVESLWAAGVVDGFRAGPQPLFHPELAFLRAQFAKVAVLAFDLPVSEDLTAPFGDLGPDDPASLYPHDQVAAAASAGITRGSGPDTFSPWASLTRAQAVTMVVRALDGVAPGVLSAPPAGYTGSLGFTDPAHAPQLISAEFNGLLEALPGFGPGWDPWSPISREEAAGLTSAARDRFLAARSG